MMDMKEIEKKWQERWEKEKASSFNKKNVDKKFYCLEMFSYPSGAKLHAGHWYNYGPTDSYARYKKMKGYEVFQPWWLCQPSSTPHKTVNYLGDVFLPCAKPWSCKNSWRSHHGCNGCTAYPWVFYAPHNNIRQQVPGIQDRHTAS